jgi:hypothetical protein
MVESSSTTIMRIAIPHPLQPVAWDDKHKSGPLPRKSARKYIRGNIADHEVPIHTPFAVFFNSRNQVGHQMLQILLSATFQPPLEQMLLAGSSAAHNWV